MLRKLYDWLLRQAAGPHAPFALAVLAFVEPIFFPIPPDIMLAPMVVTRPKNMWRYVLITWAASVIGGCVAYGVGYYFVEVATFFLSKRSQFSLSDYKHFFHDWGVWLILAKGLLPVPYMIITYAAGAAQFSFWQFAMAAAVTRGARFALSAYLAKRFGPQVQARIEKNLMLWTSIFVVVVVALLWAIHLIS